MVAKTTRSTKAAKLPGRRKRFGTLLVTLLSKGSVSRADLQEYPARTVYDDFETIASLETERIRGGLRLAKGFWSEQSQRMGEAKYDIADRAASFFHAGVSVSVGCGSTTFRVCERMRCRSVSIEILTNNLALTRLDPGDGSGMAPRVNFVGGQFIPSLMGTVGPGTEDGFKRHVRWGVIGASGIDGDGRLFISHEPEVSVVRTMLDHVQERVLVVLTADKLGRADLWEFASLDELVTTTRNGARRDREVVIVTNDPQEWKAEIEGLKSKRHVISEGRAILMKLREMETTEKNLKVIVVERGQG
jgi:DeoR/GlpR family transcriptional regulator of sugar metabolism